MSQIALSRCFDRWYKLTDHPVQLALINAVPSGIRFPVATAGRRSGKTERFKRFLAKQAMENPDQKYFAGAPTRAQAKRIYWDDLKLLTFDAVHKKRPSESELKIYLPNNSTIEVLGLDEPARIEGIGWTGGGIDEIADLKPEAMNEHIMPAMNTVNPTKPDYRPWCWFLGVPDGLNHYYDLAEYAKNSGDPNYAFFHWKSSEILAADIIEAAKRTMSAKQYAQEYEASFETATGRIYEDYSKDNLTDEKIFPVEQLLWFHDFNFTPMSSGIAVRRKNKVFVLDEIILSNASAVQTALEFTERYKNHSNKSVIIYGDPSGRIGEKHGLLSNYLEIEQILRSKGWTFERRVKSSTRSIRDGQNAVRAKIRNALGEVGLYVNRNLAKYMHKALSTCTLKKGSSFLEEESEYQHIATAIRYMIDYEWPVIELGSSNKMY